MSDFAFHRRQMLTSTITIIPCQLILPSMCMSQIMFNWHVAPQITHWNLNSSVYCMSQFKTAASPTSILKDGMKA